MNKKVDTTVKNIFLSLLPIEILSVGIPALNALIVNVIIGQFLGESGLAAQGYVNPIISLESALMIFAVGSQILCGQMLGRGDKEGIKGAFSTGIIASVVSGAILGIIMFVFPYRLAGLLGVEPEVMELTVSYLKGLSFGVIPMLVFQCFLCCLILECKRKESIIAVTINLVMNLVFIILNLFVFRTGFFGIGISNSLSYVISALFCLPYFCRKDVLFKFSFSSLRRNMLGSVILLGAPTSVMAICDVFRNAILNGIVSSLYGVGGMAAFSLAVSVTANIGNPIQQGHLVSTSIIASVLYGERDVKTLRELPETTVRLMAPISLGIFAIFIFFAAPISSFFGASPENLALYVHFMRFYSVWIACDLIISPSIAIYQATGRSGITLFFNVMTNLIFAVIVTGLTAVIGAGNPVDIIGLFSNPFEIAMLVIYYYAKRGEFPKSIYRLTDIPNSFSVTSDNRFSAVIRTYEDAMDISEQAIIDL
ncbi:MAG: MATE family efflux transporter [Lachnospiraceae bacterium]|nr:MATE family efflux transporter [Lachnospiraceae bacterium]